MTKERDPEFTAAWEAMGCIYSESNIEKVYMGWEMAKARLAKADDIIRELLDHEGAEGWSDYLNKMIEEYGAVS